MEADGTMTVEKSDIVDLHNKIDRNTQLLAELNTAVAVMSNTISGFDRPCPELKYLQRSVDHHLEQHERTGNTIKKTLIRKTIDVIVLLIGMGIAFWVGSL